MKVNDILQKTGNHISNYSGMPDLREPVNLNQFFENSNLINEELNYNVEELNSFLEKKPSKIKSRTNKRIRKNLQTH